MAGKKAKVAPRADRRGSPRPATGEARRPAPSESGDLGPDERPVLGDLPWGYGEDRVTAIARDPYWIFVYWELTDEAIARARAELEAPDAACHLRVYDTTYRLFDGTNANWWTDVPIYRPANNHYVHVGRPASTFHIDIGVRSGDGRFARIARSGAVETPRDSIAADTRAEWMTVTSGDGTGPEYRHRYAPRLGAAAPHADDPGARELQHVTEALMGEGWSRAEWREIDMGGRTVRWMRWKGPSWREVWRTTGTGLVEIFFEGERREIRTTEGVRVVFGPWRVRIHQPGPAGARRVIDWWTIEYAWLTEGGAVRFETLPILERMVHAYRWASAAGSEARLLAGSQASEALHIGASEWAWLSASEFRLQGASETLFMGASELRYLGASELAFAGASELLFAGASERMPLGASEALALGASEALHGGASEALLGGASDWPLPPGEHHP